MEREQETSLGSWARFIRRQAVAYAIFSLFGFFVTGTLAGSIGGIAVWTLVLIYFIPYEIAASRKHPSKWAIGALNFFLGWSFLGWVAALVWALATNPIIK